MPPKPLIDLKTIDLDRVVAGPEQIRRLNPQRYEMEHLDAVVHHDPARQLIVGRKDVREYVTANAESDLIREMGGAEEILKGL